MTEKKPADKTTDPDLKDVEPGSDADETPVPEVGETPPNPNEKKPDARGWRL